MHLDLVGVGLEERRPEIVFRNARLVNVFTGEILKTDFAVEDGYVIGPGDYHGLKEVDLRGRIVCPGLIDGHVHLESSMVTPAQFARAVVPLGTTAVVADPHEIANVGGVAGVHYMLGATEHLPMRVHIMLPSCVPATNLETSGARLTAADLVALRTYTRVLGLGEVMDVPAVLGRRPDMVAKLEALSDAVVDGHAPGLGGKELNAYILAGIGSDHESTTAEEGLEKLRRGMHLMIREGSVTKNLKALLPLVNEKTSRRCFFVTDDRHPKDLLDEGHINYLLRLAVGEGLDPVTAIQMATINTAEYFGLGELGAVAPGYRADFLVLEDLEGFRPLQVYHDGRLVADRGKLVVDIPDYRDQLVTDTVRMAEPRPEQLGVPARGAEADVIGLIPGQIVTKHLKVKAPVRDGCFVADPAADLVKLAVVERHRATGNVGVGLISGFGLREGALATSVAHDSHNIVVAGAGDDDMLLAVVAVAEMGGGLAVVSGGRILGTMALPIAGLMSLKPVEEVEAALSRLRRLAFKLGVKEDYDPFMTLSFLALPVVPELKLTDLGLVEVKPS
ncbi:MAG TPA: adenine deaminase [Bacillota bacterium]